MPNNLDRIIQDVITYVRSRYWLWKLRRGFSQGTIANSEKYQRDIAWGDNIEVVMAPFPLLVRDPGYSRKIASTAPGIWHVIRRKRNEDFFVLVSGKNLGMVTQLGMVARLGRLGNHMLSILAGAEVMVITRVAYQELGFYSYD